MENVLIDDIMFSQVIFVKRFGGRMIPKYAEIETYKNREKKMREEILLWE